ncbi:MAG: magnesium/cobalt transporter CorA [Bacteroidia bacterium]|nr:magnesium/cobalt transporter CorA [Bacteroidia bacterium]
MARKTVIAQTREHRRTRFGRKAGLAPGTLTYLGEKRDFAIKAELFRYTNETIAHKAAIDLHEITFGQASDEVYWYHVTGVHQPDKIAMIGQQLGLHVLALEDIVHTEQRPKVDDYDTYLYLVVKMIDFDQTNQCVTTEQLSIVLCGNTLVSFIEDKGDVFEALRERLKKGNMKLRKSGADYLMYSMLDMIVDNYFVVLEKIGDQLQELEFQLLDEAVKSNQVELHRLKKELIFLRKAIWPMREVIGLLTKSDSRFLKGNTDLYLRDVYDHCVHAIDTIETYRDLTSGLMDIYLNSISNKMNMVMKTLTIIATIFIPLTFIVGIYGMNFDYMPELRVWWAYPAVWGLMIAITGGMLWYFKKKAWF